MYLYAWYPMNPVLEYSNTIGPSPESLSFLFFDFDLIQCVNHSLKSELCEPVIPPASEQTITAENHGVFRMEIKTWISSQTTFLGISVMLAINVSILLRTQLLISYSIFYSKSIELDIMHNSHAQYRVHILLKIDIKHNSHRIDRYYRSVIWLMGTSYCTRVKIFQSHNFR